MVPAEEGLSFIPVCVRVCVSERVGGAGDRGTQVGTGERGGGADVQGPELWELLQPGREVQTDVEWRGVLERPGALLFPQRF